jgi:hypothetical protein
MSTPEPCPHPLQQARTTAAEIRVVIERLLAGEAFLADRPWAEIWWGLMHLDLFSGWRIAIWIERDALGAVHAAVAPDGRDWIYGCQRDDWTLGPDAKILEPLALLSATQRQALEGRLRRASCWPAPEPLPGCWTTPLHQLQQLRPPRSASRPPRRTAAPRGALCAGGVPGGRGTMVEPSAPAWKP